MPRIAIQTVRSAIPAIVTILVLFGSASSVHAGDLRQIPARQQSETNFSSYDLTVELIPERSEIAGTMTVDWINTTDESQASLYFRLFPNADYYGNGGTDVLAAAADRASVEPIEGDDPTLLEIPLPEPLAVNDRTVIELAFQTVIPEPTGASFGVFGGSIDQGWTLADWYPIVAGWEEGSGWYLAPPTRFADPTFGDAATYRVSFTAPGDLHVVSSGHEMSATPRLQAGTTLHEIESGPGRDFTLSLFPKTSFTDIETAEEAVDDVIIRASLPGSIAVPGLTDAIVEIASDAFPLYESWLGAYEQPELDLTIANLSGATGVAWNGIIWLDLADIAADGALSEEEVAQLRFVITHEVGHQWIAGIIGSNNNDHGFMSEGLTNTLAILVLRDRLGESGAEDYLRGWVAGPYAALVRDGRDAIADEPVTNDSNIVLRSSAIYGKAALGFEAIRQEIGDPAFFAALSAYAADYRFAVSDPADLLHAFEAAAERELSSLWSFWFEESTTTIDDVDAVLNGFAD